MCVNQAGRRGKTGDLSREVSWTGNRSNNEPWEVSNNCTFNTHNVTDSSLNGEHTKQQAAEVMDVEVVKYEGEDHSNSPLIPYLTHPELAQPLIEWLHRSMANQSSDRDRILPFKAAFEKHLLKRVPQYEDFKKEFGDIVCQSQYSRLMGNDGKYSEDEFKRVLASLKVWNASFGECII